MQIKSIAVFCGSKIGADALYAQHAAELGLLLAKLGLELIYGGGNRGLMGVVANAVMQNGGKVTGVIPEMLLQKEAQHHGITELHVVSDMHVRKKMMYELCGAAIVLPGGYGTLDELFEMLTWNSLNIHNKKIILLNSAGYYTHLMAHLDMLQQQGFLYESWKERLIICDDPFTAISLMV